eukprot:CAMPEP_0113468484 /NCGR_PEP_ID=MMETSP0014_2-20120614/15382_1 /TAXON_ID=2857 /ORGANISM="Nitzschia sp." /LENGTH=403 /DNA_ID=CAMNT_0000360881 /DNA_START=210 /DNA_END=1421 /DNA_ORIENTATION=+ /assembly_acc=CAM_ASM_000159
MTDTQSKPTTTTTTPTAENDWRIKLLGEKIIINPTRSKPEEKTAEEQAPESAVDATHKTEELETAVDLEQGALGTQPTTEYLDGYDYVALFFGANYCPFCKKFAPSVVAARHILEVTKRCKVLFVSNDRDEENFAASCTKVQGVDVMSYDLSKTAQMRDMFGLKTIPALMILKLDKFHEDEPFVVSNARDILEQDPACKAFPWGSVESKQAAPLTPSQRFWIQGENGHWWSFGHKNVSELHPNDMYMDEHAVRMRAGLLNVITWVAIMNVFHMRDPELVNVIFGLVIWEFVTSMVFGLTPFSPAGIVATLMAMVLQPSPLWKPAAPKRFAWAIGATLATTCFIMVQYRVEMGDAYRPAVTAVALTCNLATWLEGNAGFCVGCFMYNNLLVPYLGKEECSECKL